MREHVFQIFHGRLMVRHTWVATREPARGFPPRVHGSGVTAGTASQREAPSRPTITRALGAA
eukprot:4892086-Pyramimonas_sp.AAC.1